MPSAYITALIHDVQCEPYTEPLGKPPLRQRFIDWFNYLPEISRDRPYSMEEMERPLGTQGKYLSPILLSLGWQRRRKWSSRRQYHRYWVPPAKSDLPKDRQQGCHQGL